VSFFHLAPQPVVLALGDNATALKLISEAIADPKAATYTATFLEHRYEVRKATDRDGALEDLRAAYDACKDDGHRQSIADKLARF